MSTFDGISPSVGSRAPEVAVTGLPRRAAPGAARVLAFVDPGSIETTDTASLRAIRGQLRGLGAELVVLSRRGVWAVHADDPVEQLAYGDDLAVDVAATSIQYGVRAGEDALFVIDGSGVVRFAFRPERRIRPVFATLAGALGVAGDAMQARAHHDPRQRMMFTRREWSVTCLVAGCASALFAACKEARRPPPVRRPIVL